MSGNQSVVRTTSQSGKKFQAPAGGVGSNVTFDDPSDGGFHASRKAFTEGREKSESQKDFTEGNSERFRERAKETKAAIQDPSLSSFPSVGSSSAK